MRAHTPGSWTLDKHALGIWAPSAKGGETKIFDVRGWGYLTGKGLGALALPYDEAKAIQSANGTLAAAAPDLLFALEQLVSMAVVWETVDGRKNIQLENSEAYLRARAALAKASA